MFGSLQKRERREIGKIVSIVNQKGGVGKTTTAINLSASITMFCQDVLLIDIDPQANATSGIGITPNEKNIYTLLLNQVEPQEAIYRTAVEWLDIIPSTIDLVGAEAELKNEINQKFRLKEAISKIKDSYDFLIIDCPPSLGLLTINALASSNSIIIPLQCEYYSLEGINYLLKVIDMVKRYLNKGLEIDGILMTMYDGRVRLSDQVVSEVRKFFKEKVYETIIPRNIRLAEAPSYGKPVMMYDSTSRGSATYIEFAKEFIQRCGRD